MEGTTDKIKKLELLEQMAIRGMHFNKKVEEALPSQKKEIEVKPVKTKKIKKRVKKNRTKKFQRAVQIN